MSATSKAALGDARSARVIFVTATDTGAGKTTLTALLLHHLRSSGLNTLALKPFCSGGTEDVDLLMQLQDGELRFSEVCPFYFPQPVAPLVAARKHRKSILLRQVATHIRNTARKCSLLLVEGSGGLLVPLGEGFTIADLICELQCEVIVVAVNKLGTINQTLMTNRVLREICRPRKRHPIFHGGLKFVVMERGIKDESTSSNLPIIQEFVAPSLAFRLPFFGASALTASRLKKIAVKSRKTLAAILK